jgi:hypothetical protein
MIGKVPDSVAERRGKTGFVPLMERGLFDRERATFLSILGRGRIVDRAYVDPQWLREAMGQASFPSRDVFPLWMSCALELWLDLE